MSKHLFKCKYPTKYKWNISNLRKLSYGGLFLWIKLFIPQSPHITGFFKDSQMLQQNSECRRNNPWTRCTCWMKELRNPLAWDADWRFDTKVKCPTGRASFWVKVPTVRIKTPVKCPCYARRGGGWAILDLSGTLCFKRVLVWKHLTRTQLSPRNARGGSRGYPSSH